VNHEGYDTLAAVYAVGALDGDDRAEFERHLAEGCPLCAETVRGSHEALTVLAHEAPPMVPPASVKAELMRRIEDVPAPVRERAAPRRWVPWVAGAAAAVFAAGFTGAFVAARYEAFLGHFARELHARYQARERDLENTNARLREQTAQREATLRAELATYRTAVDLLRQPGTRVVPLRGRGPSPTAAGQVIWHENTGGAIFVANLPPAPPGKTYELWTITGATPRPAGLFQVDASGRATHPVEPMPGQGPVNVFAVTLEPEGGVSAPTGPMMLASK
jgi:anti-sigma-K factor RskA